MGRIIIKRSSILIEDYQQDKITEFDSIFCYSDPITKELMYSSCIEFYKNNAIIPRGLIKDKQDAEKRLAMLYKPVIEDSSYDKFDELNGVNIKSLPRDDVQKAAIRFMIGTDEYESNANLSQYSINLNTGAGKTYVTIMTSIALSLKPIIIASTVGWIQQWQNKYLEYTDITEDEMYVVQGSSSITDILMGLVDVSKYKIFFATHSTLHSYGTKYGWEKITKFFKAIRVGMKVFDEAHMNFDNICAIDFHTNTYKTYYLTATPARSSNEENKLYQKVFLKNVAKIDLFDVDKDRRTNYAAIFFKSNPDQFERRHCASFYYGLNRIKYMNYLITKPAYYDILHFIINKYLLRVKGKILIYIGTNEAIFQTRQWLIENYPELTSEIGVYTSMVEKEDKESELNKRIILSTTKSTGAASDIADLKLIVVLNEPFKSEVLARQTLGRVRGNDTLYLEIVDTSFLELKNYYKSKFRKVFNIYALKCVEVDLSGKLHILATKYIEERNSQYKMPVANYCPMIPVYNEIQLRTFDNNLYNQLQSNQQSSTIKFWRVKNGYGI